MVTDYEARKLVKGMHRELDARPLAVGCCSAGLLLIVVGLALASGPLNPRPDSPIHMAEPQALIQVSASPDTSGNEVEATGKTGISPGL